MRREWMRKFELFIGTNNGGIGAAGAVGAAMVLVAGVEWICDSSAAELQIE